jgi:hypothetical protein
MKWQIMFSPSVRLSAIWVPTWLGLEEFLLKQRLANVLRVRGKGKGIVEVNKRIAQLVPKEELSFSHV